MAHIFPAIWWELRSDQSSEESEAIRPVQATSAGSHDPVRVEASAVSAED